MPNSLVLLSLLGPYMPHGMCYLWNPPLLWLHVVSDGLIALAYFAIPPVLVSLVVKARREMRGGGLPGLKGLPYDWMFVAFGLFIVACGSTHLFEVITVWKPVYWASGGAKAVTAVASLATAAALPPLVPRAVDILRGARDSHRDRLLLEEAHAQLRELYAELRDADRLKSEFFANVSHELRTPLNLILGPAERMLESGTLPPMHRRQAEMVHRNAEQLLAHVEDLLEAARLQNKDWVPARTEVDLARLVRDVTTTFQLQGAERDLTVDVLTPETLTARVDYSKTERIVLNLLSNALKFTGRGGRVRVTLRQDTDEIGGAWGVLVVEDDGPGVPEDLEESVFEPFQQFEVGEPDRPAGLGLGLTIARDFARMQGGAIAVGRSTLGGARIELRLPVGGVEGDAGARRAAPSTARAALESDLVVPAVLPTHWTEADPRPKVLLVEPDPGMRAYLADILDADLSCACVAESAHALALARDTVPALVVTGLMMSDMPGEDLIGALRRLPGFEDVPILVITGRAEPKLAARLLAGGVQDYMVKPVHGAEMLARARNLLSAASARSVLKLALGGSEGDLAGLSGELASRKRELEAAIRERDTLLSELHHRVKGNLQTVSSLMNLQIRALKDASAQEALEDSRSRIRAISLLHERLYQGGNPAEVDLDGYLRGLASELTRAFGGDGSTAKIHVHAAPVTLRVERAVACGLVAHELVLNALEHGGSRDGSTEIELSLVREGAEIELTVGDRGRGDPEALKRTGLGLELVEALARQLNGTFHMERRRGLYCRLRFPAVEPRPGR